jgi:tetratricopeptide (TPR) repeat protein
LRLYPDNAQGHNLLGVAEQQAGNAEKAIGHLERAASIKPIQPAFVVNLARAHLLAGNQERAMQALQTAFDEGIRDPTIVSPLASLLTQQGRLGEGLAVAERVEAGAQSAATVDLIRGDVYMQAGRMESAAQAYQSALDATDDWRVATRLAVAKSSAGQSNPAAALAAYVKRNAGNQDAWFTLGQVYQQTGDIDRAIEQYDAMIRIYPNNAAALNNLAWLLYERGDERALAFAERAAEAAPQAAAVADTLGWILVEQDETERGLQELQRALDIDGANPDIRYHVAAALAKSGQAAEAKQMLSALLSDERPFASRDDAEELYARL